jgi:hypothetical protein
MVAETTDVYAPIGPLTDTSSAIRRLAPAEAAALPKIFFTVASP